MTAGASIVTALTEAIVYGLATGLLFVLTIWFSAVWRWRTKPPTVNRPETYGEDDWSDVDIDFDD